MVVITWEYVGKEKQRFVVWFSNMGSHTMYRNDNTMETLGPSQLETSKHQMLDVGKRLNWNTKLKYHIWSFQMGIVFQYLIDVAHFILSLLEKDNKKYKECSAEAQMEIFNVILVISLSLFSLKEHIIIHQQVKRSNHVKWPCQCTRPLTCGCNWITTKIYV